MKQQIVELKTHIQTVSNIDESEMQVEFDSEQPFNSKDIPSQAKSRGKHTAKYNRSSGKSNGNGEESKLSPFPARQLPQVKFKPVETRILNQVGFKVTYHNS